MTGLSDADLAIIQKDGNTLADACLKRAGDTFLALAILGAAVDALLTHVPEAERADVLAHWLAAWKEAAP